MARIKITGYLETTEVDSPALLDPGDPTGLSVAGFEHYRGVLGWLDDVDFEVED